MKSTNRIQVVLLVATLLLLDFVVPSLAWWQSIQQVAVGGGGASLPLDGISIGIKADYSTRQLLTAYAGKSMQVQRASDSGKTDIGFVANVFDTASLNTFCSGTTCTVSIWYDQSGGGHDLIPGVTGGGSAPVIYTSGAVTAINGKPAVSFTAASNQYLANASMATNPANTLYQNAVLVVNSFSVTNAIMGSTSSGLAWLVDATTGVLDLTNPGVTGIAGSSNSVAAATGAVVETQYNSVSGAWAFWINRASGGTGTSPQTIGADTVELGSYGNGFFKLDGFMGEYIAYDLVGGIPGASQTSIENNQKTYWGTP